MGTKNGNGPNILTALQQHSGIVVDCGFRNHASPDLLCYHECCHFTVRFVDKDGSTENLFTTLAPQANKKGKEC